MSIIQDPETYERFERVVLIHGVRRVSELAYSAFITEDLPRHEFLGDEISDKLIYYPTVTREPFRNNGRLTRSEEHTSELQSLMRISYAVFCLTKKNTTKKIKNQQ